jgi:hypothetical protein
LDSGNADAFYGKIAVFFPMHWQPGENPVKAAWH